MSDQGLKLVITRRGLDAAINAKDKGLKAALKWVSVGDAAYHPNKDQAALRNELDKVEFSEYVDAGETSLQAVAKFSGGGEYAIREIGFWLDDGTLFGIISSPGVTLNYKAKNAHCIQPFTLNLSELPTDSVEVVVGIENLNILIDEQMMSDAVAFTRSQKLQTKQLLAHMKLSDKLRQLESENV